MARHEPRRLALLALLALYAGGCSATPSPSGAGSPLITPTTTTAPSATVQPIPTSLATSRPSLTPSPLAFASSERLTLRPVGTVADAPLGYAEYLPPGYGDGTPRPLLLFFHSAGESGDGSEAGLADLLTDGVAKVIEGDAWPEARPFVVLMPQHEAVTDPRACSQRRSRVS